MARGIKIFSRGTQWTGCGTKGGTWEKGRTNGIHAQGAGHRKWWGERSCQAELIVKDLEMRLRLGYAQSS